MKNASTFTKNGTTTTAAQIVRAMAKSRVDFGKSFAQQSGYAVGDLVQMAHEVGSYTETSEFFAVLKRSAAGIAKRTAAKATARRAAADFTTTPTDFKHLATAARPAKHIGTAQARENEAAFLASLDAAPVAVVTAEEYDVLKSANYCLHTPADNCKCVGLPHRYASKLDMAYALAERGLLASISVSGTSEFQLTRAGREVLAAGRPAPVAQRPNPISAVVDVKHGSQYGHLKGSRFTIEQVLGDGSKPSGYNFALRVAGSLIDFAQDELTGFWYDESEGAKPAVYVPAVADWYKRYSTTTPATESPVNYSHEALVAMGVISPAALAAGEAVRAEIVPVGAIEFVPMPADVAVPTHAENQHAEALATAQYFNDAVAAGKQVIYRCPTGEVVPVERVTVGSIGTGTHRDFFITRVGVKGLGEHVGAHPWFDVVAASEATALDGEIVQGSRVVFTTSEKLKYTHGAGTLLAWLSLEEMVAFNAQYAQRDSPKYAVEITVREWEKGALAGTANYYAKDVLGTVTKPWYATGQLVVKA